MESIGGWSRIDSIQGLSRTRRLFLRFFKGRIMAIFEETMQAYVDSGATPEDLDALVWSAMRHGLARAPVSITVDDSTATDSIVGPAGSVLKPGRVSIPEGDELRELWYGTGRS